jgi:hypothetical protein
MRDQDRHKAQLEFSNMTDLSNNGNSQNGEVQMKGKTVELPIVNRTWSALETLAEVSRHFDLSEKHDDRPQQERGPGGTGTSEPSRADRLELQEQYTLDNPPVSYEQRVQREKKSKQIYSHVKSPLLTFQSGQPEVKSSRERVFPITSNFRCPYVPFALCFPEPCHGCN